jgi:DNA polymerase-4
VLLFRVHRKILHLDLDAFYASVEERDRPQLRGRPLVVASASGPRALVAAASDEARKLGVRVGMTTKAAEARCPDLVVLPVDLARYRSVSQQLHAILGDFSHRIEVPALDRAWLDLTFDAGRTNVADLRPRDPATSGPRVADAGMANAAAAARRIRERVRGELGLTCSIGVAPTKVTAKLASGLHQPNGLTVIRPEDVSTFLHPLPVDRLDGVGKATARRLAEHGVHTIGELAKLSETQAVAVLGRTGSALWRVARGEEPRVGPDRTRRTRGTERTFPIDVWERAVLERELERQIRSLAEELGATQERARTVTVRLRYQDFEATTRTRTFDTPTGDPAKLGMVARALLGDRTDVGSRAVRMLGVTLSALSTPNGQLELPLPRG